MNNHPGSENEQILLEKLRKLEKKYESSGQNLISYLDGLYETDFLNYWDYIHLDTLLSLQVKRTVLPDEEIFIVYHQITELYFKLIISELKQICRAESADVSLTVVKINRINRYFEALNQSFRIMADGMDSGQFMRFRMALLPASGFQSVQFRLIEIMCTQLENLSGSEAGEPSVNRSHGDALSNLYWRSGATDLNSGKKTITLERFEEKYNEIIRWFAADYEKINLNQLLEQGFWGKTLPEELLGAFRLLDRQINILWRSAHFNSASRYLRSNQKTTQATGGTNWMRYLPPRMQKIVFFPSLWSAEELSNWGQQPEENSANQRPV